MWAFWLFIDHYLPTYLPTYLHTYIHTGETIDDVGGISSEKRSLVCDVVLSTVREFGATAANSGGGSSSSISNNGSGMTNLASSSEGSQYPYTFEIFSANRKSYLLQAESAHDYQAWIQAIR